MCISLFTAAAYGSLVCALVACLNSQPKKRKHREEATGDWPNHNHPCAWVLDPPPTSPPPLPITSPGAGLCELVCETRVCSCLYAPSVYLLCGRAATQPRKSAIFLGSTYLARWPEGRDGGTGRGGDPYLGHGPKYDPSTEKAVPKYDQSRTQIRKNRTQVRKKPYPSTEKTVSKSQPNRKHRTKTVPKPCIL
jgi:hypothetical protein